LSALRRRIYGTYYRAGTESRSRSGVVYSERRHADLRLRCLRSRLVHGATLERDRVRWSGSSRGSARGTCCHRPLPFGGRRAALDAPVRRRPQRTRGNTRDRASASARPLAARSHVDARRTDPVASWRVVLSRPHSSRDRAGLRRARGAARRFTQNVRGVVVESGESATRRTRAVVARSDVAPGAVIPPRTEIERHDTTQRPLFRTAAHRALS